MFPNKVKEKFANGVMAKGCLIRSNAPDIVEMIGFSGIDLLMIDVEHSGLDFTDVENLIRAADVTGMASVVRVPRIDEFEIGRYLDCGAVGIVAPGVSNAEEAKKLVDAIKYAPLGHRGLSNVRGGKYGFGMPQSKYVELANKDTMAILIIENADAVKNIDEIMAIDGIDGGIVGRTDLALSLGYAGDKDNPAVMEAYNKVVKSIVDHGKAMCGGAPKGKTIADCAAEGYKMVTTNVNQFVKAALNKFNKDIDEFNAAK